MLIAPIIYLLVWTSFNYVKLRELKLKTKNLLLVTLATLILLTLLYGASIITANLILAFLTEILTVQNDMVVVGVHIVNGILFLVFLPKILLRRLNKYVKAFDYLETLKKK